MAWDRSESEADLLIEVYTDTMDSELVEIVLTGTCSVIVFIFGGVLLSDIM